MGSREGMALRQRALEALEKSTKMFEVALELLKQGNYVESNRVRNEARTQRTISSLLMSEANSLDENLRLTGHSRYHDRPNIRTQGKDNKAATH